MSHHVHEDHRWNTHLSPEASARKLLRAEQYLIESWQTHPHLRDGVQDAVTALKLAISRCRSDLRV